MKPIPASKTTDHYADAFGEVMHYAETRVGKREIRTKEDLRNYIIESDERRKNKGKNKRSRISDKFLDAITSEEVLSKVSRKNKLADLWGVAGKVLNPRSSNLVAVGGSDDKPLMKGTHRTTEEKIVFYRAKGRQLYDYPDGKAIKNVLVSKKGSRSVRFRDIDTGHFVKTKSVTEE